MFKFLPTICGHLTSILLINPRSLACACAVCSRVGEG